MSLWSALRGERSEARAITATGSVGWGGVSSASVNEDTARTLSAVWACQTLIADAIATLPVDTYRRQNGTRIETTPPPWIMQPNPIMNPVDFETQRVLSLMGWGNAYVLLIRKNGASDVLAPVLERWPIEPWRVTVQGSALAPAYFVDGKQVPAGNVQHIRGYWLGGLKGMSVIEYGARSLNVGRNAEEYTESFYENGAAPSGVLRVPQLPAEVSKDVVDRLRDQFASRHSGRGNAGRPMVLTGGTEWTQTSIDPATAQLLESRKFQIEEVCRWYRVPPHEIQHITDHASQGGGQGIEQMSIRMAQRTLLPWTIRLEQADSKLVPRGQFVRMNVDASIRADLKSRWEAHEISIRTGASTPNRVNALEDSAPVPGGDAVRVPMNTGLLEEGQISNSMAIGLKALHDAGFTKNECLAFYGLPPVEGGDEPPGPAATTPPTQETHDGPVPPS